MQPACIATAMAFLGRMRIIFTFHSASNILKCNIETHPPPSLHAWTFYFGQNVDLSEVEKVVEGRIILVYNLQHTAGFWLLSETKLSGLETCWSTAREEGFPVCTNEKETIPQTPAYLGDNVPFSNAGCVWLHDSLITTLLYILPLPSGSMTFILLYLYHPSELMNRGLSINSYATALAPLRVSLPTVHFVAWKESSPFRLDACHMCS